MANSVDKLKCGGMKRGRGKQEGGIVTGDEEKVGLLGNNQFGSFGLSTMAGFGDEILGNKIDELLSGYDIRENPAETVKRVDTLNVGRDIGATTLKGAGAGFAAAGPVGALIGGGLGLLGSGIKAIAGKKRREEERREAVSKWSNLYSGMYKNYLDESGYQEGGMIKGKGGPKSDAIRMTAVDGSFVVPAENAEIGMELGKTLLGWDDNTFADRMNGGSNVMVSDGEVFFTPEEVGILRYHGVDLDQLAPKAEPEYKPKPKPKAKAKPKPKPKPAKKTPVKKSIPSSTAKRPSGTKALKTSRPPHKQVNPQPHKPTEVGESKAVELPKNKNTFKGSKKASTTPVGDGSVQMLRTGGLTRSKDYGSSKKPYPKVASSKFMDPKNRRYPVTTKEDWSDAMGLAKMHGHTSIIAKLNKHKFANKKADGGEIQNLQNGGWKYDPESGYVVSQAGDIAYDQEGNEFRTGTSGQLELSTTKTPYGQSIYNEVYGAQAEDTFADSDGSKEGDEQEFKRKWYEFAPELAGTLQTLGGAYGFMRAGRRPDLNVSRTLKKLSGEVRRLSQFGYEPAVLNALDTQIEKARRDTNRAITGAGGSPMEVMAKLQNTLSTVIDKKAGVLYADAAEKARKFADVLRVDTAIAGQEFDIDKINLDDWYRNQEVFADLFSAGVSNIIGARQLKSEQDFLRKTGGTWPDFSALKTRT